MKIPLEDGFTDVIAKAQRGLGLSDRQLGEKSGLTPAAIQELQSGEVHAANLRAIAPILQLSAEALVRLAEKNYQPSVEPPPEGFASFHTPFEDYTVNSYLAWDVATRAAVVFDTGSDATELLHTIASRSLQVRHILLTHTHADHIFDLDRVLEKTGAPAHTPCREPLEGASAFADGASFSCGSLKIRTLLTNGHSPGGTTFFVEGLEGRASPLAIVGDSIFAGSMGGAAGVWQQALANNREKILTLPASTIICPGHGPLTTVGQELANNPFFAPR